MTWLAAQTSANTPFNLQRGDRILIFGEGNFVFTVKDLKENRVYADRAGWNSVSQVRKIIPTRNRNLPRKVTILHGVRGFWWWNQISGEEEGPFQSQILAEEGALDRLTTPAR